VLVLLSSAVEAIRDRAARATPGTVLTGLIGAGIGPSLSPPLHETEARRLGLALVYARFDLDDHHVPATAVGPMLAAARDAGYRGLNITHPCKQVVLEHLDELSPDAAALAAVNTVVFREGRAIGHNTDWSGFARGLRTGLPDAELGSVVLLGAGGAGAAVAHGLLTAGAGHVRVFDLDTGRAAELAAALAGRFGADRASAGVSPAAVGSDGGAVGRDGRAPGEPDRAPVGPDLATADRAWAEDRAPAGPDRAPSGPDGGGVGADREPSGPDLAPLGPDRGSAGTDGELAGLGRASASADLPTSGSDRASAGADRAKAGPALTSAAPDLATAVATADGLVHATPTGMAAHPGLPLPATFLRPSLWVAEVVYRPLETELVRAARALGARVLDGGRMAVFQAADAFALFTGTEPDAARMLRHLAALTGTPPLERQPADVLD
jgi:shikimate 5-dehydrogenase